MSVTAAQVKELRETTGAGMMDCKKALGETNGDMEAAIDWLRTKGLASAAKKSGRTASEGLVGVASEGTKAAVVELNSETDFVARNEQFQGIVAQVAKNALAVDGDVEALKNHACPVAGKKVSDALTDAIATIGENMNLRRSAALSVNDGVVATYIHNATAPNMGKIGVLVALESSADKAELDAFGKQIAMHVAAAAPVAMKREDVSQDLIDREREVFKEQAIASGKPAEIAEKMVEGRLRKYFEEIVLPEQVFVIDGKAKVSEIVDAKAKELGAEIKLVDFVRFELGEGIEKEVDDFAAEVAKAAGAA